MRLTQCITAKTFFLLSISVGLNMGGMGLGFTLPAQAIAAPEIPVTMSINNVLSLQKSPLSPPETNEPKPRNIQGGA